MSASRTAGFTLLEVLVAMTIAALALVVMFRSGGEGLFAVETAGRAEQAIERAQSHLAAVGRDIGLLRGESEGDDGGGYRWRLLIAPAASWRTPVANTASAVTTTMFDVEVAVSWPAGAHERSVVLRTRRLGAAATP